MNTLNDIDYYVYVDGACSNNGKPNAKAGIGIYFKEDDERNLSKRVIGKQTNNTAELLAIIETYNIIEDDVKQGKNITIVSDSEYAIRCATTYGEKCAKKNWQVKSKNVIKDIPNAELVKKIYNIFKDIKNVSFTHIIAHTGKKDVHSIGNDNADRLANLAIGVSSCPYNTNPSTTNSSTNLKVIEKKIYLNVPYARKEEVKKLGGKWEPGKKKWYIYEGNKNKEEVLALFAM